MSKRNAIIKSDQVPIDRTRIDSLYHRVSSHIDKARQNIQHTIDLEMVRAYWLTGREIVEEEQHGEVRAEYGRAVLKKLSARLQKKYKSGFSVDTLEKARKFYLIYQSDIENEKSATLSRKSDGPRLVSNLSWSHY